MRRQRHRSERQAEVLGDLGSRLGEAAFCHQPAQLRGASGSQPAIIKNAMTAKSRSLRPKGTTVAQPRNSMCRSAVLHLSRERLWNIFMTAKKAPGENSNRIKSPDDWVTGDEEMTGAQQSYLETLASEAHERVAPDLTKADASKEIDRLKAKTGRGRRTPAKTSRRAS